MDRNKQLITPKQAADILGVSVSTIRRWTNDGTLKCYRVGKSGYRKFDKLVVKQLKDEFYGTTGDPVSTVDDEPENTAPKHIKNSIVAESHPQHYLMHKYWGRKAHNVVNEYIACYTEEGDTVLEPFMGSGVTVIEGIKLNRKVIGIDINPMSKFIVENTISKVNLFEFTYRYQDIIDTVLMEYGDLYETICPYCGCISTIETAVWENDSIIRIRGNCPQHKTFITDATEYDIKKYERCTQLKNDLLAQGNISYPTDNIMQYVKRSGRATIDELFSDRALIILSRLRELILQTKQKEIRNLLLFCFTSMLSNVSRMLPGDKEKATYKSGWVISKFWTPKIHTERNIFGCMSLRYKAIIKGKQELKDLNPDLATLYVADSESLSELDDNSIDYIFTDPPYGESIAYLALSHFWNSWLTNSVDYDDEIIIDPYRNKGYTDYAERTNKAYKELFRVLKDEHYMSFTFHNRDLNVWKAILDACTNAGFILENIVLQEQAVNSGTQGINKKNTLTGDFVYSFKKDTKAERSTKTEIVEDSEQFIKDCIDSFISNNNGATPSELYEYIIPIIVKHNAYTNRDGKVVNIENILKENYEYIESQDGNKIGGAYKWTKKTLNALDLFAGAGGFSEGFRKADINVVAAVEFNDQIAKTYKYNHPNTTMIVDDIKNVSPKDLKKLFTEKGLTCDIIFGGPPCQGFSMAGKRIRNNNSFLDDPRNFLFKEYIRIVECLKPKVFVIENVPGILNYKDGEIKDEIYKAFKKLGYKLDSKVLCAADYGVPQLRNRAVFIGTNLNIDPSSMFPTKTNSTNNYVTVRDAISDLPPVKAGEGSEITKYDTSIELTEYQKRMISKSGIVYNHESSHHKEETLKILSMIKQGQTMKDLPEKYRTKSVHSGAYGRMEYDKPSYTLTTRLNTPSVGRITHPVQNRTITPREAARIQSFPDDYRFLGDITSVGMQIGNAVPPQLAYAIAKSIIEQMANEES
ncbi:MAG: DNA (cytosine-5-)-methyltransferase [Ruminococcus sp.]